MSDVCVEKGMYMYMYYTSLKKLMHIHTIKFNDDHYCPPPQLRVMKTAIILSRLIITAVSLQLP